MNNNLKEKEEIKSLVEQLNKSGRVEGYEELFNNVVEMEYDEWECIFIEIDKTTDLFSIDKDAFDIIMYHRREYRNELDINGNWIGPIEESINVDYLITSGIDGDINE